MKLLFSYFIASHPLLSIKKILHKLSDDEAELNPQDAKASDADTSVHNHNHNPNPTPEAAKENTAP